MKGIEGAPMSAMMILLLVATITATSFLSGVFGMAGGLILMGVLLALLPLPAAMALHAITQIASNGWRGLLWWRHVRWRAAGFFLAGCALAFGIWMLWRYVPSKPVALILLGVSPFLVRLVPADYQPDPERFLHGALYGSVCMTLMLLTGVSGPLIDAYFLGGGFERRQIVATKAVCQIFGHAAKFAYFGGLVDGAAGADPLVAGLAIAASMVGTSLARPVLERLTDTQYRRWATHIITAIAVIYLAQGCYLLLWPSA
jgi:uncharacterized membrane protein YfcA